MTPDQFKAWFEGFCEAIEQAPTPEQWAKIKGKVTELKALGIGQRLDPNPNWHRQWVQNGYSVGEPFSSVRPRLTETKNDRIRDLVTGADLGPAD
jgi:hypothetical protein